MFGRDDLRAAATLLSALVLVSLTSCRGESAQTQGSPSSVDPGVSVGTALAPSSHFYAKAGAMPPGARIGLMVLFLTNQSDQAVTLESVTPSGDGIGSILKATSVEAAPLPHSDNSLRFAPGGVYQVDPPALLFIGSRRCNVQVLTSVDRFTLAPGKEARIRVILEAAAEGKYDLSTNSVVYDQVGERFVQYFPVGIMGSVDAGASIGKTPRSQAVCVGSHGVQLLNP